MRNLRVCIPQEGEIKTHPTTYANPLAAYGQHRLGHIDCEACAAARLAVISGQLDSSLLFPQAAEQWLQARTFNGSTRHRFIKPRTVKSYQHYIRALERFFRHLKISEIHLGHMREYQHSRAEKVGPNKINQELGLLTQIMRRCGAWTQEMEDWYEPLQREETDIPHALTIEEQDRFLHVLSSRKEYEVVYWYTLISLSTTCGTLEMRSIQLGHINVFSGILNVPSSAAKNKYRQRTVPLTDEAKWAIGNLIERAKALGASQPHHFLFPLRPHKNIWDVTKPMTEWGIRKPWEAATAEAKVDIRLYDLRHTAATRYAEAGTPIPIIMSYMGHVSRKMFEHYCRVCEQAQRHWQEQAKLRRTPVTTSSMWKSAMAASS